MTNTLKLSIPMKPKPAPRPRVTTRGTYNPKDYTDYKNYISLLAKRERPKKIDGAVMLIIEYRLGMPKSWSKKKKAIMNGKWHISRPDLDNLDKGVKDALTGVCYRDDSQVALKHTSKAWASSDMISISVYEL